MSTPPAKKTKWQEVIRFTVKWAGASDVEGLGGVLMLMREWRTGVYFFFFPQPCNIIPRFFLVVTVNLPMSDLHYQGNHGNRQYFKNCPVSLSLFLNFHSVNFRRNVLDEPAVCHQGERRGRRPEWQREGLQPLSGSDPEEPAPFKKGGRGHAHHRLRHLRGQRNRPGSDVALLNHDPGESLFLPKSLHTPWGICKFLILWTGWWV